MVRWPVSFPSMRPWVVILGLVSFSAAAGDTPSYLPDGSKKVAENRYRSPHDWEYTWKSLNRNLPESNYPRKWLINQPGIKAKYIANPTGRGGWEGINVYQTADDIRMYVVLSDDSGKRGKKSK